MSSPNLGLDLSPINLNDLLSDHSNDPNRALAALVSRHNRLLHDYAVLRQEKEVAQRESQRAAVENQQLWRSLKVTSPRPAAQRQNSEGNQSQGSSGRENARGLGIGALPEKSSSQSLRKASGGSSGESTGRYDLAPPLPSFPSSPRLDTNGVDPRFSSAYAQSSSQLRSKAATPPPTGSPRQADSIGASNLRKASSLDLGRSPNAPPLDGNTEGIRSDLSNGLPRTPPSGSRSDSRESSPRLPSSASMPSMALNERRLVSRRDCSLFL